MVEREIPIDGSQADQVPLIAYDGESRLLNRSRRSLVQQFEILGVGALYPLPICWSFEFSTEPNDLGNQGD